MKNYKIIYLDYDNSDKFQSEVIQAKSKIDAHVFFDKKYEHLKSEKLVKRTQLENPNYHNSRYQIFNVVIVK